MSDPDLYASLPDYDLKIEVTEVKAKPRKLKHTWSMGPSITRPDNVLDLLKDAMEDPSYDPSDMGYKGRWRHPDGSIATPEEIKQELDGNDLRALWGSDPTAVIASQMADEMAAEIDREILKSLGGN